MKTIPTDQVIVPEDRQRKEFKVGELNELSDSIDSVGLLQPIVLRTDGRTLIAGERRLRAIMLRNGKTYKHDGEEVKSYHIPFVLTTELTAEQLEEAELHENLRRVNLTWQEEARAIARLHRLRQKDNPAQTLKSTAAELLEGVVRRSDAKGVTGSAIDKVSSAVLLEEYLDDPLVSVARSATEAKRIVRDHLEDQARRQRAKLIDISTVEHKLFLGDCYEDAKRFPGLFDVIITDPPYGIDIHEKDTFDSDVHEYDDSKEAFERFCHEGLSLAHACARTDAHIYVFCDIRRFEELFLGALAAGWVCWPRPLIWNKGNTGSFGNIEYGFRACYDAILFARKGDRKTQLAASDVISVNQPTNLPHPAGKPAALYLELLRRSALPGDTVGDFFCGHGPIFSASMDHRVTAYGWEKNPRYHAMSMETIDLASKEREKKLSRHDATPSLLVPAPDDAEDSGISSEVKVPLDLGFLD